MNGYTWSVTGGTGSSTSNTISVIWGSGATGSVSVNYTDLSGCTAGSSTVKNITIHALPAITGQPGNQTVCAGNGTATFTVTATGTGGSYTVTRSTFDVAAPVQSAIHVTLANLLNQVVTDKDPEA